MGSNACTLTSKGHYIYCGCVLHSISIWYSALIIPNWFQVRMKPLVQTHLLGGSSPGEDITSWVISITRDHAAIREEPFPYIPPITAPAALSVDIVGMTHQRSPRHIRVSTSISPNVLKEHNATRYICSAPQLEV